MIARQRIDHMLSVTGMQKLCKRPTREVHLFGIFRFFFFPLKQAQERSKRSRNDRVTANFDGFNKISYIPVTCGPKIMLLGSCEGHGCWSHVQAGRCTASWLQVADFVDIIFVSLYSYLLQYSVWSKFTVWRLDAFVTIPSYFSTRVWCYLSACITVVELREIIDYKFHLSWWEVNHFVNGFVEGF